MNPSLTPIGAPPVSAFLAVVALFCLLGSLFVMLAALTHHSRSLLRPWLTFYAVLTLGWSFTLLVGQLPLNFADRLFFFRLGAPFWSLIGAGCLAVVRGLQNRNPPWGWLALAGAGGLWAMFTQHIAQGVAPTWFGHAVIAGPWHPLHVSIFIFIPFLKALQELFNISRVQACHRKRWLRLAFHYTVLLGIIGLGFDVILPMFGYMLFNESALIISSIGGLVFLRLLLADEVTTASLQAVADGLFHSMREGVLLLDDRGRITRSNPAAQTIFAQSPTDLEGTLVSTTLPGFSLDALYHNHPFAWGVGAQQRFLSLDLSAHTEGTENAGYILRLEDITELREAREALGRSREDLEVMVSRRTVALARAEHLIRRQEDFLRSLLDNLPFPVWAKDTEGNITLQNARDREMRGMRLGKIEPWNIYERQAIEGNVAEEIQEGDGSEALWLRTVYAPIRSLEAISGIIAISMDISDQKKAEQTRLEFQGRLAQSHKMEAIGSLAGGIAHDFNNILGALRGFVELAQESLLEEHSAQPFLKEALVSTDRARKLVDQLLSFARGERRRHTVVDATPVLKEIIDWVHTTLPNQVHLETHLTPGTFPIAMEATDLHRILSNLTSNAVHAMGSLGGLLEIGIDRNAIDSDKTDTEKAVHIWVADSGYGISPDNLNRIFDPFFTTKGPKEGLGLGLSVVHTLIRNAGGNLNVRSRLGEGTRFDIFLPDGHSLTRHPNPKTSLQGLRCHILFSQQSTMALVKELLERVGTRVYPADDLTTLLLNLGEEPNDLLCIEWTALGRWPARIFNERLEHLASRCLMFYSDVSTQNDLPKGVLQLPQPINPNLFYNNLRTLGMRVQRESNAENPSD